MVVNACCSSGMFMQHATIIFRNIKYLYLGTGHNLAGWGGGGGSVIQNFRE